MSRGLLGRHSEIQVRQQRRDALREADLVILAGRWFVKVHIHPLPPQTSFMYLRFPKGQYVCVCGCVFARVCVCVHQQLEVEQDWLEMME